MCAALYSSPPPPTPTLLLSHSVPHACSVQVRGEASSPSTPGPESDPVVEGVAPPCLSAPGTTECPPTATAPDALGANGSAPTQPPPPGGVVEEEVQSSARTDRDRRASLAVTVRSNRSTVAALPFDPLQSFFTTEGHLFLLKPNMFDSPG